MWWLGSLPWAYWPISPDMSKEIKEQLEEFKKLIESGNIGMIEEMQDVMKGGNK